MPVDDTSSSEEEVSVEESEYTDDSYEEEELTESSAGDRSETEESEDNEAISSTPAKITSFWDKTAASGHGDISSSSDDESDSSDESSRSGRFVSSSSNLHKQTETPLPASKTSAECQVKAEEHNGLKVASAAKTILPMDCSKSSVRDSYTVKESSMKTEQPMISIDSSAIIVSTNCAVNDKSSRTVEPTITDSSSNVMNEKPTHTERLIQSKSSCTSSTTPPVAPMKTTSMASAVSPKAPKIVTKAPLNHIEKNISSPVKIQGRAPIRPPPVNRFVDDTVEDTKTDKLAWKKPVWAKQKILRKTKEGAAAKSGAALSTPITKIADVVTKDRTEIGFAKPSWIGKTQLRESKKGAALKQGASISRPIGGIKAVDN